MAVRGSVFNQIYISSSADRAAPVVILGCEIIAVPTGAFSVEMVRASLCRRFP